MGDTSRVAQLRNKINGSDTIAKLFQVAFEVAFQELSGAEIAALATSPTGNPATLNWPEGSVWAALYGYASTLADRGPKDRLRLRAPERDELLRTLSPTVPPARLSARSYFLLALALDDAFATLNDPVSGTTAVVKVPPVFFRNLPSGTPVPAVGQMTPLAACRRWMQTFWYVGRSSALEGFGSSLRYVPKSLGDRAYTSLKSAADAHKFRIALVTLRDHEKSDLVLATPSKDCFAVTGYRHSISSQLVSLRQILAKRKVHLAVLPELCLTPDDVGALSEELKHANGSYPSLVVAPQTHVPTPDGSHKNLAYLLDSRGDFVLTHEKMEPYFSSNQMEDILPRGSNDFEYLDTPLGRLAISICKDVRSDVPMLANRLLGVTLLVVPAYSERLDFALEEARLLGARQATITASVNPASSLRDALALYVPVRGRAASETLTPMWSSGAHHCGHCTDSQRTRSAVYTFEISNNFGPQKGVDTAKSLLYVDSI